MSRRYDLECAIAIFGAEREIPRNDIVDLIEEVLMIAEQVDIDFFDEDMVKAETERVRESVAKIYSRVIATKLETGDGEENLYNEN